MLTDCYAINVKPISFYHDTCHFLCVYFLRSPLLKDFLSGIAASEKPQSPSFLQKLFDTDDSLFIGKIPLHQSMIIREHFPDQFLGLSVPQISFVGKIIGSNSLGLVKIVKNDILALYPGKLGKCLLHLQLFPHFFPVKGTEIPDSYHP